MNKMNKVIELAESLHLSEKEYLQLADLCTKKAAETKLIKYALTFEAYAVPKDEEEGLRLDHYFEARNEIADNDLWVNYIDAAMQDSVKEYDDDAEDNEIPVKNVRVVLDEMMDPREIKGAVLWDSWDIESDKVISALSWRIEDRMAHYGFQGDYLDERCWYMRIKNQNLLKKK